MVRRVAGLFLLVAAIAYAPGAVHAQVVETPAPPALDSHDRIIQQLLDRVEALERELRALKEAQGVPAPPGEGTPPPPATTVAPTAPGPAAPPARAAEAPPGPARTEPSPTSAAPPAPEAPAEEEREVTRIPLAEVSRGGSLLGPGVFQIETNLSYSHNESSQLIVSGFSVLPLIIMGSLQSERIKSDSIAPTFRLRYGLLKDLQAELDVPVAYQTQSRVRLSNASSTIVSEGSDNFGLGDVEASLTYQPIYESGWIPDVTVSLRAHAPTGRSQFDIYKDMTSKGPFFDVEDFVQRLNAEGLPIGTGLWSVTGSLAATKAFDPVVVFGSLGYTYNISRNVTTIQITGIPSEGGILLRPEAIRVDIKSGDSVFFSLGAAVALTGQLSLNFGFSDRIGFPTTRNGQRLAGSSTNQGLFGAGFTLGVSPSITLDIQGSIGLTADAPNFGLGVSLIKKFDSVRDLWPFGK
jgi:hypothetical protein